MFRKRNLQITQRILRGLSGFLEFVPTQCILCRRTTYAPVSLCAGCVAELPAPLHPCAICGEEMPGTLYSIFCSRCLTQPPPFALCRSALLYQPPVNRLITSFKFSARFETGKALSYLLCKQFIAHYNELDAGFPNALVPVPLHNKRLQQRGFNQALEICKVLAGHSRIKLQCDLLFRCRHTAPQSKATSLAARRKNLHSAFRVAASRTDTHSRNAQTTTIPEHIALVDDVVTTGSTVAEAAMMLRRAGVQQVDVWCLARANR